MEEEDSMPNVSKKQDPRLPPTEIWQQQMPYRALPELGGELQRTTMLMSSGRNQHQTKCLISSVLKTKDGRVIRSHKGIPPPAFINYKLVQE